MADLNYVYFCVPFAVNRHQERNILLQPLQESQYLYSDDRQISLHPELRTIYTKLAGLRCDLPPQHHITARSCSSPWTTSTPATPVLLGSNSFLYLSPAVERFRLYLSPAGERSCLYLSPAGERSYLYLSPAGERSFLYLGPAGERAPASALVNRYPSPAGEHLLGV